MILDDDALTAMLAVIEDQIDALIQDEPDPIPRAWLRANRKTLIELCLARSEAASLKAMVNREAQAATKH